MPEMKLYNLIKHTKRTMAQYFFKNFLSGKQSTNWVTGENLFQLSCAMLFSNGSFLQQEK